VILRIAASGTDGTYEGAIRRIREVAAQYVPKEERRKINMLDHETLLLIANNMMIEYQNEIGAKLKGENVKPQTDFWGKIIKLLGKK